MEPRPLASAPPLCHPQSMRNMHALGDIAAIVRLARCANMPVTLKRYGGTVAHGR